jgi:uncharacterized protein YggE
MKAKTAAVVASVLALALAGVVVGVGAGAGINAFQGDDANDETTTAGHGSHSGAAGPPRTITVTGHGEAEAPPDEARVIVAVVAEGDDPAAVRDDLAAGADALRRALSDAGVAEEDIDTVDFRIEEPHRPYEPPAPTPRPERPAADDRGVHVFAVTVDDVDRAGPVVDAAIDAGAEVRHVAFGLSEERRADLRDEALTDAMDDARRQAETLAAAGDLEVTGVRSIDASQGGFSPGPVYADEEVARDADGGTVFSPDDTSVRVELRAIYDVAETGNETDAGSGTETEGDS